MNEEFNEQRQPENAELREALEDWKNVIEEKLPDDIKNISKWLEAAIICEQGHVKSLRKFNAQPEVLADKENEISVYEIQKRIIREVIKEKGIK